MDFLSNALIVDGEGRPTRDHELILSQDFDELREWTEQVYMPYAVIPGGGHRRPDSALHAVRIGSMYLSRFSYGIPVHLQDFAPEAGMGMVLTTIRGAARHWVDSGRYADTGIGGSFLVDTSQTDYRADFDPNHLQVNVTFPHQFLEALHERWYGHRADPALWRQKLDFGGAGSAWHSLLEYTCRCVSEYPRELMQGPLGRHLEELLGMHMLMEWTRQHGGERLGPSIAPRHVRQAEQYLRDHARSAPTLSRVAAAVGVSVRSLSGAFRQFRGASPMAFLREERLQGVRRDLLAAADGATVASVAEQWGYANLGAFAAAYRRRFGENPSATLRRLRRSG